MNFTAGAIKKAVLANTRPGANRSKALKMADETLHIGKATSTQSNRMVYGQAAAAFFKGLQKAHVIKPTIGGRSVSNLTAKGLAQAAVESVSAPKADAKAELEKRLAEKEKILSAAGVKHKPIVNRALDKADLAEIERGPATPLAPTERPKAGAPVHLADQGALSRASEKPAEPPDMDIG